MNLPAGVAIAIISALFMINVLQTPTKNNSVCACKVMQCLFNRDELGGA
jgi:hypothetical protein